jgi:hypothetical protein
MIDLNINSKQNAVNNKNNINNNKINNKKIVTN